MEESAHRAAFARESSTRHRYERARRASGGCVPWSPEENRCVGTLRNGASKYLQTASSQTSGTGSRRRGSTSPPVGTKRERSGAGQESGQRLGGLRAAVVGGNAQRLLGQRRRVPSGLGRKMRSLRRCKSGCAKSRVPRRTMLRNAASGFPDEHARSKPCATGGA